MTFEEYKNQIIEFFIKEKKESEEQIKSFIKDHEQDIKKMHDAGTSIKEAAQSIFMAIVFSSLAKKKQWN